MQEWSRRLAPYLGHPVSLKRLNSAGGPGAFYVHGSREDAVLKLGIEAPEEAFYREASGSLQAAGLRVPTLLASGDNPRWVLLEYLPWSLPRKRWGRDPAAIRYLARWHALAPMVLDAGVFPSYTFRWDDNLISLDLDPSPGVLVGRFSDELHEIFSSVGWVHGDTNVTNWRIAPDGALALTDWARLGRAHPAIDLAILQPGLPDWDALSDLADAYCTLRPQAGPARRLARFMALAKWWSALDFLDMGRQGKLTADGQAGLSMLAERLPEWTQVTLGRL